MEPGKDDEFYGNKYSSKWSQCKYDLRGSLADIESLYEAQKWMGPFKF